MRLLTRILTLHGLLLLAVAAVLLAAHRREPFTVAYEGACGAHEGVCLLDMHTGRTHPHGHLLGASWTPDMTLAAMSNQGRILVRTPDGSVIRQIASQRQYFTSPSWSPDGRRLLYEATDQDFTRVNYYLYVADADGSRPREIARLRVPSFRNRAYWSPDGTKVIYFGAQREFGFVDMWLCDITAGACQTMPLAAHAYASWSPDSTRFVFTPGGNRLLVMGADGNSVDEMALFPAYYDNLLATTTDAFFNLFEFPLWTDDGILFTHTHERRVYRAGDEMGAVRVSNAKFETPGLYPLLNSPSLLLLDRYHTFSADRLTFRTLDPHTNDITPPVSVRGWRFIGAVQWE